MKSPLCWLCALLMPLTTHAMSVLPQTAAEQTVTADATASAELVVSQGRLKDGSIQTRFLFRTIETIRGTVPAYFEVYAPGGIYNGSAKADSRLPFLSTESTYLLHLQINDAQLAFYNGPAGISPLNTVDLDALRTLASGLDAGADLSPFEAEPMTMQFSVSSSGLLDNSGFRRFNSPDRDEPIPVYADTSTLPSGITELQALSALSNALAAWEANSTILFNYSGTQTFSKSAEDYGSGDGLVIRVQFHDTFNRIPDASTTLGFGGAGYYLAAGNGGTIDGSPFNPISFGYIVLNHPKSSLSNAVTLEEVLTHEIGHVIGLAHSSETSNESDEDLSEAIMYFQAHGDNRGASLNSYDISTVLKAYPLNTPPFSYDRVLYAITHPTGTLTNPEVNQVTITGFDLQGDALSLQVDSATESNGTFSLNASTITFTPDGYYGDTTVSDPSATSYARFRGRLSDGTNLSPFIEIRVVGFRADSQPSGAPDGIPNSWMSTYYGSSIGSSASADTDGDGFNTLQEFRLGTDPTDASSAFKISQFSSNTLEWTTQAYDLYAIETSPDLSNWQTIQIMSQTSSATTLSITDLPAPGSGNSIFYRVRRSQ
jgi:hypothetical protein